MRKAFLSLSQKDSAVPLAESLVKYDIQLIASDGTADFLKNLNIPVVSITDYLNLQPFLDGRVKTLHPAIYGGILCSRDKASQLEELSRLKIDLIDFVIVDLYPFEQYQFDPKLAIENIDIGGISLIRAAAKNYQFCTVICNRDDYGQFIDELETYQGKTRPEFRKKMALSAFMKSSDYDAKIASWLSEKELLKQHLTKLTSLAYGENPHQAAGFYALGKETPQFTLLQGKPLSYNNMLDVDAGIGLVLEFEEVAATVIKHTNPCGAAIGENSYAALEKAFHADVKSAFGGIVVLNRTLDKACAELLVPHFLELIAAPDFTLDALAILSQKPKLRVMQYQPNRIQNPQEIRSALGGVLVQEGDKGLIAQETMSIPTACKPSAEELKNLIFAFKLARHVKSNAIVIARFGASQSIGGGQTSRVDACELALKKTLGDDFSQSVLASDGFFPFADSIALIAQAGIKAIIQPGGSIRDAEVIEACNQAGLSMVLTGIRGFKH